jgi:hypothetical protein
MAMLGLFSCKTARVLPHTVAKPISTAKLIRNIENNAFDYKYFSVKRINCQFDNGNTKTSFKASILAEKDKRITIMLSKLNIPVGRLWLTPDSVKFINYLEKNYFLDDYSYLSSMLDMDLDFETVHSIISANIFAVGSEEKRDKDLKEYENRIDSGLYVIESVKKLKSRKTNEKMSDKRQARKAKKININAPVHQSVYVDPDNFKIRKIKLDDPANSRKLNIEFSDFAPVGKQLYPGEIDLHLVSPENFMELKIKLNGFSIEKENDIRFKVPEKYTRINL